MKFGDIVVLNSDLSNDLKASICSIFTSQGIFLLLASFSFSVSLHLLLDDMKYRVTGSMAGWLHTTVGWLHFALWRYVVYGRQ